jgi:hypothetical protein
MGVGFGVGRGDGVEETAVVVVAIGRGEATDPQLQSTAATVAPTTMERVEGRTSCPSWRGAARSRSRSNNRTYSP